MNIFDLDNEWAASTAMQTPLHKHRQRTGLILLGTEAGQPLRSVSAPQQAQEIGRSDSRVQADVVETASNLCRHDCGPVAMGNTAGTPQESEHRLIGQGLAIGHTVSLEIRMGFAVETTTEFSDEP
jgi:hypothetical protein